MPQPAPDLNPPRGAEILHLAAGRALLRAMPGLPGFFPDAVLRPIGRRAAAGPEDEILLLPAGAAPPRRWTGGGVLRLDPGPWTAPRFGARHPIVALLAPRATPATIDAEDAAAANPLALALRQGLAGEGPGPAALRHAAAVAGLLAEARVGGPAGLPDPGPRAALGLGWREAVLVVDPCRPDRAAAAAAMLTAATTAAGTGAAGRPLRILRSPAAPPGAAPVLPGCHPAPLAPWTLLDAAAELHLLDGDDALALLALATGLPVHCHDTRAALAGWGATRDAPGLPRRLGPRRSPEALFAAVLAATRCADPFRHRPWEIEQAIAQLADWRVAEAENRRVAVCTGMAFWKRRRVAAAFASGAGTPAFRRTAAAAVAEAARRGGAIAAWATRLPPGLETAAARAGVPLVRVEDGFVRSAGLGAGFLPGASLVTDATGGLHLDPEAPSELEYLLATARFDAALLARAARLRAELVARGVTKYNLGGEAPLPPETAAAPGRLRILVPGQVEDDLSVRLGGGEHVRTNLDLLRAARAAAGPDAVILYKPHPDVEAGFRRGRVPAAEALRHADRIVARAPMAALLGEVDAVHTITSLTGFEALLRGLAVTCWGRPFYAGWGLTEDRDPRGLFRRSRRLTLDELVAAVLILHPRYVDPVTELPCPVELLLDRLSETAPWRGGALAALRRWQGRAMAALARLAAGEGGGSDP